MIHLTPDEQSELAELWPAPPPPRTRPCWPRCVLAFLLGAFVAWCVL